NFQTARRLHTESKGLLSNVKERQNRNIASVTDVRRAELQSILRWENELQSKTNLESLSRTLAQIIGDEKVAQVIPQNLLDLEKRLTNIDQSINEFLTTSRSRLIYDRQELASDANLELAKENLRPAVN